MNVVEASLKLKEKPLESIFDSSSFIFTVDHLAFEKSIQRFRIKSSSFAISIIAFEQMSENLQKVVDERFMELQSAQRDYSKELLKRKYLKKEPKTMVFTLRK